MTGLELSRAFYEEYGRPMLEEKFPEYKGRIAAGLVGHGSECFGFDDEISRDHDFEPGFCLWITDEDERLFGFRLFRAYAGLPAEFHGYRLQKRSVMGGGSKGVHTISAFYFAYTGREGAPESLEDWLYTPSFYLAEATNGEVFSDPLGKFTEIREKILYGMPPDVRLKKIASKAIAMAQTGQYNYARCLAHGESGAAGLALARFAEHCAGMIFLLNRVHAPYYKWLFRAMQKLPLLGGRAALLERLLADAEASPAQKSAWIESLCADVAAALVREGLSPALGDYLEPYAFAINETIESPEIRNQHIMQD